MKKSADKGWNPYLAGALSGLTVVYSAAVAGKYFGTSTAFARSAAMLEKLIDPEQMAHLQYFSKIRPTIDWQWMFVIGIFLGSLIASTTSGSFRLQTVPDMWKARFGSSPLRRGLTAFLGGTVMMFGANLANGCSSGHGLSGTLQLAVSGIVAFACFFIGGIAAAHLLYGKEQ